MNRLEAFAVAAKLAWMPVRQTPSLNRSSSIPADASLFTPSKIETLNFQIRSLMPLARGSPAATSARRSAPGTISDYRALTTPNCNRAPGFSISTKTRWRPGTPQPGTPTCRDQLSVASNPGCGDATLRQHNRILPLAFDKIGCHKCWSRGFNNASLLRC